MVNEYNGIPIVDANVIGYSPLISPYHLKLQLSLTDTARQTVQHGRSAIQHILRDGDERILLIVGPCSIHDPNAAEDYSGRLRGLRERVKDKFEVVMRTYFEKPRTTVGWKGLIYEPYLDGQERINEGLSSARRLLIHVAEIGLPSATEFLDTYTPQYYGDLISWNAIGARTVESQIHRQMASGLSMPVGCKNTTDGNIQIAVDAVFTARQSHWFFGLDQYGIPSVVKTRGNPYTHIVLRGGNGGTNYDHGSVRRAQAMLKERGLEERLMIDCSHGNSNKDYRMQPVNFEDVIKQIVDGNTRIMGIMLESNINEGSQKVPEDPKDLKYGISITDSCIGWETTEKLIIDAHKMLSKNSR